MRYRGLQPQAAPSPYFRWVRRHAEGTAEAAVARGGVQELDHLLEPAAPGRLAGPDRGGHQRRQARARAGRRQGRQVSRSSTSRSTTRPRRPARGTRARPRRTRARPRRTSRRRLHRRVQLGRARRSRCRSSTRPASRRSRPANTYVGLTTDEPGAEPGEPDKYYPTGKRTYARIVPARHDPGRRAGHGHEGGRLHEGRDGQRQGGPTARAWREASSDAAKAAGLTIARNDGHRQERAELPLARLEDQGRGRGLLRLLGHHRQQRASSSYKDVAAALPEREALRPGRRRRVRRSPTRRRAASRPRRHAQSSARSRRWTRTSYPPAARSSSTRLQDEVRRKQPGPVRDLRLRGDVAALDTIKRSATRATTRRPCSRRCSHTKDRQSRARHVLDRRERRHDADRLRPLHGRERRR